MEPRCIIIDGYNVIRNTGSLLAAERHSLSDARAALLGLVTAKYRGTPHQLLVVFDGAGERETVAPLRCGVRSQIIYSRAGETADAAILRLAERARAEWGEVTVVSDDWEVRQGGAARGAAQARAGDVARRFHGGPGHLERRARHHAAVRRRLASDDASDPGPRKGNGHRAPRRRRGRSDSSSV
jgi:predicted RNA-binding protein with PIN domain